MSVSVFTAALLLAGASAVPAALPPVVSDSRVAPEMAVPAGPAPQLVAPAPEPVPPPAAPEAVLPPPVSALPPENPAPPTAAESDAAPDEDEIVVRARRKREAVREDPLQEINAASYAVVQTVDKALVAPAASAYSKVLPSPVRSGIRNFFNNLFEPINFVNDLLQIKPGRAVKTFGRFAINSTIGAVGLFDVARKKPFYLPRRRNGFANTLGYYGVKPGAFLFLPVVGPTTVRDLIGLGLDRLLLPVAIGSPFDKPYYTIPAGLISSLDDRVEFEAQLKKLREAPDPYAASRANYLQRRQAEIDALHRKGPAANPVPAAAPDAAPAIEPAPQADVPPVSPAVPELQPQP